MGDGSGFVEYDGVGFVKLLDDLGLFEVETAATEPAHGAAEGEGDGEGQRAGAGDDEYGSEGEDGDGGIGEEPIDACCHSDNEDDEGEVLAYAVDDALHAGIIFAGTGVLVPELGEVALLHLANDLDADGAADLPSACKDGITGIFANGKRFAGDKAVVDIAVTRNDAGIGGDEFLVSDKDMVAGFEFAEGNDVFAVFIDFSYSYREIGFVIALE